MLLIAVLFSGELCEAELCLGENLESAKMAVIINYCISLGDVKEWRVEKWEQPLKKSQVIGLLWP